MLTKSRSSRSVTGAYPVLRVAGDVYLTLLWSHPCTSGDSSLHGWAVLLYSVQKLGCGHPQRSSESEQEPFSVWLASSWTCDPCLLWGKVLQPPILIDRWLHRRANIKQVDANEWKCAQRTLPGEINVRLREKRERERCDRWDKSFDDSIGNSRSPINRLFCIKAFPLLSCFGGRLQTGSTSRT